MASRSCFLCLNCTTFCLFPSLNYPYPCNLSPFCGKQHKSLIPQDRATDSLLSSAQRQCGKPRKSKECAWVSQVISAVKSWFLALIQVRFIGELLQYINISHLRKSTKSDSRQKKVVCGHICNHSNPFLTSRIFHYGCLFVSLLLSWF